MRKLCLATYKNNSCTLSLVVDEEENVSFIASMIVGWAVRNIWV